MTILSNNIISIFFYDLLAVHVNSFLSRFMKKQSFIIIFTKNLFKIYLYISLNYEYGTGIYNRLEINKNEMLQNYTITNWFCTP